MSVWVKLSEERFQQRELQPCTTLVYLIKCPASERIRLHFVIRLGCSLHVVSWPYLPDTAAASAANEPVASSLLARCQRAKPQSKTANQRVKEKEGHTIFGNFDVVFCDDAIKYYFNLLLY